MINAFLKSRVTLQRLGRDPIGGTLVVLEQFYNVPACVMGPAVREAGPFDERDVDAATIYVDRTAPLSSLRDSWRVVDGDRELEVLSIERVQNPLTGQTHHYRMATAVRRLSS